MIIYLFTINYSAHVLVAAHSVRTLHSPGRALSVVGALVARLPAVLLRDVVVLAVVGLAVAGPVLAVGVRLGARVGRVVVAGSVGRGLVGGRRVRLAGLGEGREAGVLEEPAVAVPASELDEAVVSPGAAPRVLHQDEVLVQEHVT